MAIAKFINAKDIQRIHNERNPDRQIGYAAACKIKRICRAQYEKECGKVQLYSETDIPLSWYERYFGEDALKPKTKKDTLASGKQTSV